MRDLKPSNDNVLVIKDGLSGENITLYYRTPTTKERVDYQRRLISRKGNKLTFNDAPLRVEYGLAIVTGFNDGDFGYDKNPISSNPASPNYREDWKDLLAETASDILSVLGFQVFEVTRSTMPAAELEVNEDDKEDETTPPFGTRSGG